MIFFLLYCFRNTFPSMAARNIKHKDMRQMTPSFTNPQANSQFVVPFPVKDTWTHDFCCIPYTHQETTPSVNQLESLRNSGLAKKKITFKKKESTHDEVCEELVKQFPQLKNAGGFTLHRGKTGGQGRPLEPLKTNWYGIRDLKSCGIGSACIYIRPVQKSLDLRVTNDNKVSVIILGEPFPWNWLDCQPLLHTSVPKALHVAFQLGSLDRVIFCELPVNV